MLTFKFGKELEFNSRGVLYSEGDPVKPDGTNVYFVIGGNAMIARKRADQSYFRLAMAEQTLFGLQDATEHDRRLTSAFHLEFSKIYRWKTEDFFSNISVDIVLAKAATFSLCRELRFLNEKREREFTDFQDAVDGKIETTENMEAAGALYGMAFQKESEEIPAQIVSMFGVDFKADETIIAEGEQTEDIFILFQGEVAVSVKGNFICTIGSGEIFGEMSHFEKKPRAATIKAKTDAKLLKLEPKNFNVLYQLHPKWSWNLLKSLCRRIRAAYGRL